MHKSLTTSSILLLTVLLAVSTSVVLSDDIATVSSTKYRSKIQQPSGSKSTFSTFYHPAFSIRGGSTTTPVAMSTTSSTNSQSKMPTPVATTTTSTTTTTTTANPPQTQEPTTSTTSLTPFQPLQIVGALWGSLGVAYSLAMAVRRVLPIAIEPFLETSTLQFTPIHWSLYALCCLFFAHAEGYKGFQKKVAPLVVKRSFLLSGTDSTPDWGITVLLNYIFAPTYSVGLFRANKKRLITSWCVSMGVAIMVATAKRLPPIWRCIVDAGVVVGLSYGSLSVILLLLQALIKGELPPVDACLPLASKKTE